MSSNRTVVNLSYDHLSALVTVLPSDTVSGVFQLSRKLSITVDESAPEKIHWQLNVFNSVSHRIEDVVANIKKAIGNEKLISNVRVDEKSYERDGRSVKEFSIEFDCALAFDEFIKRIQEAAQNAIVLVPSNDPVYEKIRECLSLEQSELSTIEIYEHQYHNKVGIEIPKESKIANDAQLIVRTIYEKINIRDSVLVTAYSVLPIEKRRSNYTCVTVYTNKSNFLKLLSEKRREDNFKDCLERFIDAKISHYAFFYKKNEKAGVPAAMGIMLEKGSNNSNIIQLLQENGVHADVSEDGESDKKIIFIYIKKIDKLFEALKNMFPVNADDIQEKLQQYLDTQKNMFPKPASAGSREAKRDVQVPLSPSSSALVCPPAADGLGRPALTASDDAALTNGSTAGQPGCSARQAPPSSGSSSSMTSSNADDIQEELQEYLHVLDIRSDEEKDEDESLLPSPVRLDAKTYDYAADLNALYRDLKRETKKEDERYVSYYPNMGRKQIKCDFINNLMIAAKHAENLQSVDERITLIKTEMNKLNADQVKALFQGWWSGYSFWHPLTFTNRTERFILRWCECQTLEELHNKLSPSSASPSRLSLS